MRSKVFIEIIKIFSIITIYTILSLNFVVFVYNLGLLPILNCKDHSLQINNFPFLFSFCCNILSIFLISVIVKLFIKRIVISNYYIFFCNKDKKIKLKDKDIDYSNPFLYASKTIKLTE